MKKSCPFCKKSIEKSASDCPQCKRVIIERIGKIQESQDFRKNVPRDNLFQRIQKIITHTLKINKRVVNIRNIAIVILIIIGLGRINGNDILQKFFQITLSQPITKNYNTLPNGTVLQSSYGNGFGRLSIDNGTDYDAVAKLINTRGLVSVITVYIQSKSTYTVTGIEDGNYSLKFHLGKDWDTLENRLKVEPTYAKFRENFSYTTSVTEEYDGTRTRYAEYQVTLNPVVGGTAKTNGISETEFFK